MDHATFQPVNKPVFLKLGGSLITDKTRPFTPRPDILESLAGQIARARRARPELRLVLGHGSGSFGHVPASQHRTRSGVSGREAWEGFSEVWYWASSLNHLVIESLHRAGIPAVSLAPVSAIVGRDGRISSWNLTPLKAALANGLLPVIYGDVIFDRGIGGTILSTEDLFDHLARRLKPQRILLAGLETGVWKDFPKRKNLVEEITPGDFAAWTASLKGSTSADVTGGMQSKVNQMLTLVTDIAGLEVSIFSGEGMDNLCRALLGEAPGTSLHS